MKALSENEIKIWIDVNQALVGARLQELNGDERHLGLGLYLRGNLSWVWFDLNPSYPLVVTLDQPFTIKKKMTPVLLFLSSHFRGRLLKQIRSDEVAGRGVIFDWDRGYQLKARLFPHGQNLILSASDKNISWNKVKDLTNKSEKISITKESRSPAVWTQEWLSSLEAPLKVKQPAVSLLDKKKKSLLLMLQNTSQEPNRQYLKFGQWLKENQSMDVPHEFQTLLDSKKSLSKNIQGAFQEHKKQEAKFQRSLEKIEKLKKEISNLETSDSNVPTVTNEFQNLKGKGFRRRDFPSGLIAYLGANAKENMELLKEARAWDLWLHLKNYPSAHAIIRRGKNQEVTSEILTAVGQWLASQSQSSKRGLRKGDLFDILICEVRYVKPVKGDKLGRVTIAKEKTLRIRFDDNP